MVPVTTSPLPKGLFLYAFAFIACVLAYNLAGTIASLEFEHSSGHNVLDEAARK